MQARFLECFEQIDFDKIVANPNILIAAKFWDDDKYKAAKTCYKVMRQIDDLIDHHKAEHSGISQDDRVWFRQQVTQWLGVLNGNIDITDKVQSELVETFKTYCIPLWPFENFAEAMLYDIDQDGFATLETFLKYSKGASVAPSSIFVHLCGLTGPKGAYKAPVFDVEAAAHPSAIFSYLVHIIRDFQKDQFDNLSYFGDDLIAKNGLSREKLKEIANGAEIPAGFRELMREYIYITEEYRLKTLKVIDEITPFLEPASQLSLQIIYNLYLMVYERIDVENGKFTTEELNPTPAEIKERVYQTIVKFES